MAVWEIVEQGQELRQQRRPFAVATVVRCERPVSAHPGDQALITDDGRLIGWIGGSCTEPVIVREALRALHDGQSCLVRLGPPDTQPGITPDGVVIYPMTCHSGGTLEVFVDPCLPSLQSVLVGHAPVIEVLATLAGAAGFAVVRCDPRTAPLDPNVIALDPHTYVVVATHGEADEETLAVALRSAAGYVALVASRRRAEICREALRAEGLTNEQVGRLTAPAGLDLGATTPAQIAVSIVAEMVQHAAVSVAPVATPSPVILTLQTFVDPVCGMTVEPTEGTPSLVYEGTVYYFCCTGCRRQFERDPQRFLASAVGSAG